MFNKFVENWKILDWNDICFKIHNQTTNDVENALNKSRLGINELISLLSPAAESYIEILAQKSKFLTRQRFGNTIRFFVPLYLSNLCKNECSYCGFSISNNIKRKILNKFEITQECKIIKSMGFNNILLVTGEHQNKVGINYFLEHIPYIRKQFSSVLIEVQPLKTTEYITLKSVGIDGVLIYQETYNLDYYKKHHTKGNKKDFFFRLDTPDRLGETGIDKIGLGVLFGLSNCWRTDSLFLGQHLLWLQNNYWKSRFSISFPRLRPCFGKDIKQSISSITERQLIQTICAFRLFAPDVEITLSTRESPQFRDFIIPLGITHISAFSKTYPGGYSNRNSELEQFTTYDNRTPQKIAELLYNNGLQPVWKDWDAYLGHGK